MQTIIAASMTLFMGQTYHGTWNHVNWSGWQSPFSGEKPIVDCSPPLVYTAAMEMARSSYITKMFLLLALVMTLVTLLVGTAVLSYLYRTVEQEVIEHNRSLQKYATDSSAQTVNRLVSLAQETSYDSVFIQHLYAYRNGDEPTFEETVSSYLDSKAASNIWVTYPEANLISLHLLYDTGKTLKKISPPYADTTILDQLSETDRLSRQAPTIFSMQEHPGKRGVQQYSFSIGNPISDPVNGDFYGYIVLDVSEKVLYDSYKDLQSESKMFVITDAAGAVLSAKDKTLIGTTFLDPGLAGLGQRASGYMKTGDGKAILFYQQIGGTEWYLVQKSDIAVVMASLKTMELFIGMLFSISILAMLFIISRFRHQTAKPITNMNLMLDTVASGDLSVRAEGHGNDEFGQMATSFNAMVGKLEELLETVTETEKAKRLAELDFLRAQINPHFIYNTLSSIRFSIEMGKAENASEMLYHFTKLLRSTLNRSDQFISLREEMTIIDYYEKVQSFRYPDEFVLHKDLEEGTLGYEVPSFILQPLVENAIFHNEGLDHVNIITIRSRRMGQDLCITIEDNGFGMNADDAKTLLDKKATLNKVGLQNVQERIRLNYGPAYGLTIHSKEHEGTAILIHIPARNHTEREETTHDEHPGS
jgi:two-component system sensor histidine kinase YesM